MGMWKLKGRPQLLATLGISAEELSSAVLSKYGAGAEAHQALVALVASKQAAVMEGGAEHWTNLQEQRRLGPLQGGPAAAAAPQAGQQEPALAAPPPLGRQQAGRGEYVPSWRQQQHEQGAAAAACYQQQAEPQLQPTPPASSQLSPAERRAQWQQQSAQGPPPGPTAAAAAMAGAGAPAGVHPRPAERAGHPPAGLCARHVQPPDVPLVPGRRQG